MSEKIKILQLGTSNWQDIYHLPENIEWVYMDEFDQVAKKPYEIVIIGRQLIAGELSYLMKATKAYTLFVVEGVELVGDLENLYTCRMGKILLENQIQDFLLYESGNFFPSSYGEKYNFRNFSVSRNFNGSIHWNGECNVQLDGSYGDTMTQIGYWRNNIPVFPGQAIELWLEYDKDPEVEIALSITEVLAGSICTVQNKYYYTEQDLEDMIVVDNQGQQVMIFVSLLAKGNGRLKITALHDRYCRRGWGYFLPGGERYVTSDKEELFAYFDPGDLKPPLNVFFSGYKTRQGFEGYNIMRRMGSPFLLIAEARLEGGSFYMGSEEYEDLIKKVINKYMNKLGFDSSQVVMAGLSMGTYGALYYACDIRPYAIILGKPLASIGDIATNERLLRPGGFPTSLDILKKLSGLTDRTGVRSLNNRFWDKFDKTDWSESKFVVAYMIEDDYDSSAQEMLLSHINSAGVQIFSKGIHGRHNDNTGGIVSWFMAQYRRILEDDYKRGKIE